MLDFLILTLTVYRLTLLLVEEDGPLNLLSRLRVWAGVKVDGYGERYADSTLGSLLICRWCCSLWLAAGVFGLFYFWPPAVLLYTPFALSGAVILLSEVV